MRESRAIGIVQVDNNINDEMVHNQTIICLFKIIMDDLLQSLISMRAFNSDNAMRYWREFRHLLQSYNRIIDNNPVESNYTITTTAGLPLAADSVVKLIQTIECSSMNNDGDRQRYQQLR